MNTEFLALLVMVLIVYQVTKLNCSTPNHWVGFTNVYKNVIPNSPITMVSKHSKISCAIACKDEALCLAFAFHQQRRECHLYTRNVKELNTDTDPGMAVYLLLMDGNNMATQKPAAASSIGVLQPTTAALDDDTSTCFQTQKDDYQPWFLVDLMDTFLIHYILVYNEAEYPERLHDVNYEVYDSDPTINNSSEGNCCASVADYNTGKNIIRCNDGVHGRFVRISIEKSNFLTLCGLEIYGTPMNETCDTCNQRYECKKLPGGENIALNKETTHSTTFLDFVSSLAVDGNRDGELSPRANCQHTKLFEYNPWWQVDLEWMYDITSITISNRYDDKDVVGERLSDVSVLVYDSDPSVGNPSSTLCKFLPGVFGCTVRTFECDEKTVGRFIRITKPTKSLTLCEVEVTGIKQ